MKKLLCCRAALIVLLLCSALGRGKRLASCLRVEAADGYHVVIALPELDPEFTNKQIALASCVMASRLTKKKARTESSSRMKKEWPAG